MQTTETGRRQLALRSKQQSSSPEKFKSELRLQETEYQETLSGKVDRGRLNHVGNENKDRGSPEKDTPDQATETISVCVTPGPA